ncbi:unnamed protein product [Plutella xylostella]|uniref:(diamondback moth) hypothetical protein n=1 Tax=Plutella xylostella TaxID=51655 RepID=A0A8S4GA13_PLUXY|nr:unnamed protein product [Plutella xylostella]
MKGCDWCALCHSLAIGLFMDDGATLASGVHSMGEAELPHTELVVSMHALGLSLVNDEKREEIAYISISNSGIIWEQCKIGARRYKKVEPQKIMVLEEAYQRYMNEKAVSDEPVPARVLIDEKIEVDFEEMRILKPSPRVLRRSVSPGLWCLIALTRHSRRIHARLHRLQVDQQLPLPTFPLVLAPTPPPRSVNQGNIGMRPFVEVSIVEHVMEHSKVRQYKYFKLLVQEFHVKIDMGLVTALCGMFPPKTLSEQEASQEMYCSKVRQYKYFKLLVQELHVKIDMGLVTALCGMFPPKTLSEQEALEAFIADLNTAKQPLEELAALSVASDQKNFYDMLHLSPLKVHVSFSLGGATSLPTFVGTILQSIGVTLTDMNDVVFKLSYYERTLEFMSQKELISQVQSHYTGQALKQLYVLVLGLDVIGNPYGLVVGLKKGVEDLFYEPFQGAIQGPGEFAEGLLIGVRSLVGHTVGGAAGAVSRITGAMGHGLAALSLDKDYQRRRRDTINKPPANLQEGLARSGKGLVMGFYDGVTGVFTKPIEGAQEQGVEGFFKGLGKGAMGLVTRPTAGFVDFASGSLDAAFWNGVTGVVRSPFTGAQEGGTSGFFKGLGKGAVGVVVRPIGGVVDFTSYMLRSITRAADLSEDVTRIRPPRYLPADSGVRPYSRRHAEGYKMLFELEKGKYTATDRYSAHVWVIPAKEVVLCTDKRILYLEKNNVFGGWQIVWTYLWPEIPELPTAVNKGVYIPTAKKKVLGMFPSTGTGKVIFLYDEQQKKYLLTTCIRLINEAR